MLTKADINLIKSLSHKGERTFSGLFVAEGEKLVSEIIASGWSVERLFTTAIEKERAIGDKTEMVSNKEMERISHLKTPTDILALVELPEYEFPTDITNRLSIVLDGIQNPGNLGTIIRLADWFGITDLICSTDTADCFSPRVVQATMGAILRVRVHYTHLSDFLSAIATDRDFAVYGTFLEGDNIYNSQLTDRGLIIMGSEGKGISSEVSQWVNRKLYIPPYPANNGNSESLNVAVAAAIVCSEFRRSIK